MSEVILPEDIGRPAMVEKVAAGVREAMKIAGIDDPRDVHYVQTKTPLLTLATITDAKSRGQDIAIEETGPSMDLSNSTTALGIAVALGEIEMPSRRADPQGPVAVLVGRVLLLRRRAGPGADRAGGQRARHRRPLPHRPQRDEGRPGRRRHLGGDPRRRPRRCPTARTTSDLGGRLVNVFMKCEADPSGRVRGRRNIMLDDSDVHWHRQIKATVGGVAAAVTGDPAVFVSVAAVHQGPSGGGPVAAIADLSDET